MPGFKRSFSEKLSNIRLPSSISKSIFHGRVLVKIYENFIQFKPKNFCDVGKLCSFSAQYQNETVITYPDRFSAILNLNKPNNDHALLNHHFRTLQL